MKRSVSSGLMIAYLIALPLSGLVTLGLGLFAITPESQKSGQVLVPLLPSFFASLAVTLLIALRLWAHARARRRADANSAAEDF